MPQCTIIFRKPFVYDADAALCFVDLMNPHEKVLVVGNRDAKRSLAANTISALREFLRGTAWTAKVLHIGDETVSSGGHPWRLSRTDDGELTPQFLFSGPHPSRVADRIALNETGQAEKPLRTIGTRTDTL